MKPIQIPTLDDDRVSIPFTLNIKGRKPIEFRVPRRDFQPAEDVKRLLWLMAELDHDADKLAALVDPESEPAAMEKAYYLLALKPYVTAAQFKALKGCTFGQLRFVNDRWNEQSRVTLGESFASVSS